MRMRTNTEIDLQSLAPGLVSPPQDAQRIFRTILEAMAHPGRILPIYEPLQPPVPLCIGAAAVCLTLLDFETSVWADPGAGQPTLDWLRFHCGCRIVDSPSTANFALIVDAGKVDSLELFPVGEDEYPEKSATLIIQADRIGSRGGKRLSGPGIRDCIRLYVENLPDNFWEERQAQTSIYPQGIDIIFTSGRMIAALPRTTWVES